MRDGFRVPIGTEMTGDLLADMLGDYRANELGRYESLRREYEGDHPILHKPPKAEYKPDNRLVANFPRQIVDAMVGYFLGKPVTVMGDDQQAVEWVDEWNARVGADDVDAELSKLCDIYGGAYEVLWRDRQAYPMTSVQSPEGCFLVRSDDVSEQTLYAVRFYEDRNRYDGQPDMVRGTLYTPVYEVPFEWSGNVRFGEPAAHGFPGVPVIDYAENRERQGLFEGVLSLVHAYEDAISEKANDVDYYADAYLAVLGAELDEETLDRLRDSRIINLASADLQNVSVSFLSKPESDATQENLINRLERLIFTLSMVADISDDDFGTASGIAIRYRLQAMSDLALVKERKFRRGLMERWRLLLGYAGTTGVSSDAWVGLRPVFKRNLPANLLEESQIVGNLAGIVSDETLLSVLSCVQSPRDELELKEAEQGMPAAAPRVAEE